ncbi:sister-chromatid cohesion protein 3 [Phtheirospermum japonicum]|uniref:Sister-chromatid cohesion protein 3 n=1 Tax=Phtheirospermum japonicum TaxID=374723 RepID=A0A830BDT3_9LAMI|nr:sister-chromatid cohesion protein 3 [Phtheirospermum japonicum]
MMKTYPQLLRKFMSDKDKVAPLVEIIVHMNLELYSLKRQEQVDLYNCLAMWINLLSLQYIQ